MRLKCCSCIDFGVCLWVLVRVFCMYLKFLKFLVLKCISLMRMRLSMLKSLECRFWDMVCFSIFRVLVCWLV